MASVQGVPRSPSVPAPKMRRLRGSCDTCRRQKKRCDSAKMPDNKCSNCISFNSPCTHEYSKNKRDEKKSKTLQGPSTPGTANNAFIDATRSLVDRIISATYHYPEERAALVHVLQEVARYARSLEQGAWSPHPHEPPRRRTRRSRSPPHPQLKPLSPQSVEQDDEELEVHELVDDVEEPGIVVDVQRLPEHLRRMTTSASNNRYFGRESSLVFVQTAIKAVEARREAGDALLQLSTQRSEFWDVPAWETPPEAAVVYDFPPQDLLVHLVDVYFTQINIHCFVLHRPTFDVSLANNLHLRDHRFGAIVLAVCALASKNSSDPRVMLPGTNSELSAGWRFFNQIRRPFTGPVVQSASLYELQLCCLYILWQQHGNDIESVWLLSGIGLLYAQDIGAHKRFANTPPTPEGELLKRAWLFLFITDAMVSACFGRPRVLKADEFTLELPTLCDDEYWENPRTGVAFRQPHQRPSKLEFWARYVALLDLFVMPPVASREAVHLLDLRLDKWAKSIPLHLVWDPHMEDETFFSQSAELYSLYYHIQILVHRRLIQSKTKNGKAVKSLAICTNAARSIAHIADVKTRRGFVPSGQLVKAVLDSAIVLLLTIAAGASGGLSLDTHRELVDVYQCLSFFRLLERRVQKAGRFYDILCQFISANGLPLPPQNPPLPLVDVWIGPTGASRYTATTATTTDYSPFQPDALPLGADHLAGLPIYGTVDVDFGFGFGVGGGAKSIAYMLADDSAGADESASTSLSEITADPSVYLTHWMSYFGGVEEMTAAVAGPRMEDGV
ncbi:Fungal-trans domain-containing protein [Mycena kentingensis (nom. inval.)]|nr:Fungal-trans domain-containing protein [Mycena kentingensis (nom. inval.)]